MTLRYRKTNFNGRTRKVSAEAMTQVITELGPFGIIIVFMLYQIFRDKKNNGGSPELGILTDIIDKIEDHGSVPFQTHQAEDKEWKRGANKRFDHHSDRIDSNRDAAHSVSDRLTKIQAKHDAYTKKNGKHGE